MQDLEYEIKVTFSTTKTNINILEVTRIEGTDADQTYVQEDIKETAKNGGKQQSLKSTKTNS